jgi:hypothetical protein
LTNSWFSPAGAGATDADPVFESHWPADHRRDHPGRITTRLLTHLGSRLILPGPPTRRSRALRDEHEEEITPMVEVKPTDADRAL